MTLKLDGVYSFNIDQSFVTAMLLHSICQVIPQWRCIFRVPHYLHGTPLIKGTL